MLQVGIYHSNESLEDVLIRSSFLEYLGLVLVLIEQIHARSNHVRIAEISGCILTRLCRSNGF